MEQQNEEAITTPQNLAPGLWSLWTMVKDCSNASRAMRPHTDMHTSPEALENRLFSPLYTVQIRSFAKHLVRNRLQVQMALEEAKHE